MGDLLIAFPHGVWSVEELEREGSSGTGSEASLVTGRALFVPPVSTIHGTLVEEAVSALRQCIRTGDLKFALYWTAQLDLVGLSRTVWYTLLMMTYTDVGIVFPTAPIMTFEMFQLWEESLLDIDQQHKDSVFDGPFESYHSHKCLEARRILMTAASMLCTFPKSRLVSHANSAILLQNSGKLQDNDWKIKIGSNRKLSNVIRPLKDSHTMAVSKAVTCLTQYILYQFEQGMLRMADMLMHWGHTSLVWDTITKVCQHFKKLEWARYYYIKYERMWYWATGKAQSRNKAHARILFKTSTYMDFDEESMANEHKDTIPDEWKTRHDPSSPCHVMARSIPVQCLLLIVRANPGILEGVTPQTCTQYDSTVDLYYKEDGRFNRPFGVPEQAKTMFTQSGRMHHRGFDYYWNESEKLVRQQDLLDPYEGTIFKAYILEEGSHGIGQCTDESIIRRRVTEEGYFEKGYLEPNPFKEPPVHDELLNRCDSTEGLILGTPSLTAAGEDSNSSRGGTPPTPPTNQLRKQKRRFRSEKPGPPKSLDVTGLLGIREIRKPSGTSTPPPSPTKRKRNCVGEKEDRINEALPAKDLTCVSPQFLYGFGCPTHGRTKIYKDGPHSQILLKASLWYAKRQKRNSAKRRRSKFRAYMMSCGPVSKEACVRAITHSLLEKRIAPDIFGSSPSLVQTEEPDGSFYLVAKLESKPLTCRPTDPLAQNKMDLLRWCQGCLVKKALTGRKETLDSIDSWIGIEATQPLENTEHYPHPSVKTDEAFGCIKQSLEIVERMIDIYRDKISSAKRGADVLSFTIAQEILSLMKVRLGFLIDVSWTDFTPFMG